MDKLVVFVESGCPSKDGGRENMYFEKGVTYPKSDGKAGDLSVLADKLSERLPSMLIINSRVSISKKDGFLQLEDVTKLVSAHNWRYRKDPVRKLIFNRCLEIDASKLSLLSKVSTIGTDVDVAFGDLNENIITDVFIAQNNGFQDAPDKPLESIVNDGLCQCDIGYYGYDTNFVYATVKL